MDRRLNLVKTEYQQTEKRIFPRFPFSYLTFQDNSSDQHTYEVKDISYTGMQLSLRSGGHSYQPGDSVSGEIHWRAAKLTVSGKVAWVKGQCLGLAFEASETLDRGLKEFLSIENIVSGMRPVHEENIGLELPSNLKYWVRADAPVEIFIWRHKDGELSRFHMILLNNLVEWEDGKGIKTGQIVSKRDLETPLTLEDELLFEIDDNVSDERMSFAQDVVGNLNERCLPREVIDFLCLKIGAH
jgi:hypothetical protein